ncbi:hypothetical protein AMIS_28680 [Actinoplanes missouriensis 431]|uniref:Uncharacterized protein n=1 Tax=Actinoplanes missouriensis (strain ATCC 14538 / DSM 43046 / CBS 188.64 / JCM 3121 / NBRC 102363 / NCIMB 12654 / NRRL B-3342 / UNCC 431) TaxID=512565 RepID=I0H501_ACTM4|nr:lysylphosphatidylglycerol synthase domain-containing protein [Actinoplanes missouriensis]BAL88088.1 hypothetical protein AMIS_28680 [Actinoplanes missouriensis 431]
MTKKVAAWLRTHGVRIAAGTAVVAAVAVALRGRVPDPVEVGNVLAAADPRWLVVAVLAHVVSQLAFARQQRTLLAALAAHVSRRVTLAITYSRSALSMVLPAGGAMSAAFAVRQYRHSGVSTPAGLVAAGAPHSAAAATVLGYRIATFWLLLPAGLAAYLRLRRVQAPALV